jgi:hypothetical protein
VIPAGLSVETNQNRLLLKKIRFFSNTFAEVCKREPVRGASKREGQVGIQTERHNDFKEIAEKNSRYLI